MPRESRHGARTIHGGGRARGTALAATLACSLVLGGCGGEGDAREPAAGTPDAAQLPTFQVDASWPADLPENWILGQVSGVAVDARDHVWIVHRPSTVDPVNAGAAQNPPISMCCVPAPPVVEFDAEGRFVQAWGGPGDGWEWPDQEHGIFVDHEDNVWIGGGLGGHIVLKFTRDGDFRLQLGEKARTGGSNDTELLGGPAAMVVWPETNELFVADGYGNRRVIVFDAATGDYLRHWGAYGETPSDDALPAYDPDAPPARQFRGPVHGIRISNEGLVHVTDRISNRVQIFERDGTWVDEFFIRPETRSMGSTWDLAFSADADQRWIYVPDGTNNTIWIVERATGEVAGNFSRGGRKAGHVDWVHNLATDSRGNIYVSEVNDGHRVQKFVPGG
jgi:hypothetical protein